MSIKIPVSADLDLSGVQQKLNTLGQQIAHDVERSQCPTLGKIRIAQQAQQILQIMSAHPHGFRLIAGQP